MEIRLVRRPDAKMAAASPELLAALKAAQELLTSEFGGACSRGYFPDVAPVLKQIADAIEKATGDD